MRRYIVLLLITGIVWAQTDFDTLVLKSGTTYLGEYSKIEGKKVFFKNQDALAFQPVPLKLIKQLQLKDGQIIIVGGKVNNSLTLEEYQKLSTEEKAIYDANSYNVKKWALYGPTSIIVFTGSIFLHKGLIGGESWESPIFLGGSPAASLTIPYFVLNSKEKFNFPKSILTDSEKEIYKQAYSKKLKQRKIKYAVGSICISVGGFILLTLISISNGLKNSSSSGNWGPVANP
jgi:hypothetical protein|tara:strand:+ start:144 stop:839 length:696 start_codon:yes stop_codon:yes gene_type:complete